MVVLPIAPTVLEAVGTIVPTALIAGGAVVTTLPIVPAALKAVVGALLSRKTTKPTAPVAAATPPTAPAVEIPTTALSLRATEERNRTGKKVFEN